MLVLSYCSFEDIINLRCASRDHCNLVTLQGSALYRYFTQDGELAQIASLYRCAGFPRLEPSFYNLCGLRHRTIIADKLALFLVTHRMCEKARIQPFVLLQDPNKIVALRIAVAKLRPYFFILYHLFEAFRAILVHSSACNSPLGVTRTDRSRLIEKWLLNHYTTEARAQALCLWEQVMKVVARKFRPATYATKVERTLRGWHHPPASEEDMMSLVVFGGLEALYRVITIHGFASRMKAFDKMVLQLQTPTEISTKDDMRVIFGVLPPLSREAITTVRKYLSPDLPMDMFDGVDTRSPLQAQYEQDLARQSDLGALAWLCAEIDQNHETQLVADTPDEPLEFGSLDSLETCLKGPQRA